MIDTMIKMKNLNPITWKGLAKLYDCMKVNKKTLYILKDQESVLRICDSENNLYPIDINSNYGAENIESFFKRDEDIDRIVVIDNSAIDKYYNASSAINGKDMDTDEYYILQDELFHNFKGIDIFYKKGRGTAFFKKINHIVRNSLPDTCNVFVGFYDNLGLFFQMIVAIKNNKVTECSSMDFENEDLEKIPDIDKNKLKYLLSDKYPNLLTCLVSIDEFKEFCNN